MDRREFIIGTGGIVLASNSLLAQSLTGGPIYSGWVPSKRATAKLKRQPKPYFSQRAKQLAGTGRGKLTLLWKYFEKVSKGPLVGHVQEIGDCVGQAFGLGVDILDTVQIAHGRGEWRGKCSTEVIYVGSRVEIGKGKVRGDGSHGSWAAQWCRDYGILLRKKYLNGKYDFTQYDPELAKAWGHVCDECTPWGGGIPDELEGLARQHPVRTIALVTSWEEARDAIANGYPVAICSNVGFTNERDIDGFLKRGRYPWYHALLMIGADDTSSRPGGLIINSWPLEWVVGPTRFEQPPGSFWADAHVIDDMLSQEDSHALSNYVNYPRRHLDYRLY